MPFLQLPYRCGRHTPEGAARIITAAAQEAVLFQRLAAWPSPAETVVSWVWLREEVDLAQMTLMSALTAAARQRDCPDAVRSLIGCEGGICLGARVKLLPRSGALASGLLRQRLESRPIWEKGGGLNQSQLQGATQHTASRDHRGVAARTAAVGRTASLALDVGDGTAVAVNVSQFATGDHDVEAILAAVVDSLAIGHVPLPESRPLTVADDGLAGEYWVPDGSDAPGAAIVFFGGADGGFDRTSPAQLARAGLPTLTLAYWADPPAGVLRVGHPLTCGELDDTWPACPMSRRVVERLEEHGYPHRVELAAYPDIGHYLNVSTGSLAADPRDGDDWQRTLAFIDETS